MDIRSGVDERSSQGLSGYFQGHLFFRELVWWDQSVLGTRCLLLQVLLQGPEAACPRTGPEFSYYPAVAVRASLLTASSMSVVITLIR